MISINRHIIEVLALVIPIDKPTVPKDEANSKAPYNNEL